MSFGPTVVKLQKAYQALSGRVVDVSIIYKGTELGENSPWVARCDTYEIKMPTEQAAINSLFNKIKDDLKQKANSTEMQAKQYREALNLLDN